MQIWKKLRLVVLALAIAGLAWVLYLRGNPLGLGGHPATLETPYVSEEAWLVTEILHAMTELAGPAGARLTFAAPHDTAPGHVYAIDGGHGLQLDLGAALFAPEPFTPAAAAVLSGSSAPSPASPLDVYKTLATSPGPEAIVEAAARADARLAASAADAAAHEAAALTLGAFALRESAGIYYSDVRYALSRMTAHLALAAAARRGEPASVDGALAHTTLLVLANHQSKALARLDALLVAADAETAAWCRALRVRVTDDWRLVADPARATRLEQRQYFRARRIVLPGLDGADELARLGVSVEDEADWRRIGRSHSKSVADAGTFVADALSSELAEVRRVRRALGHREPANDADAISVLDDEAPEGAGPRVLPWPAWAAQIQRHLASYTAELDRYYRHRLAGADAADGEKRRVDAAIGRLRLFPLGALGRTTGPQGGLGDFEYIRQGIALAAAAPEVMQYAQWTYLGIASQYEPVARRMPAWQPWFAAPSARMPYEADQRAAGARPADVVTLTAIATEAPYDYAVAAALLRATSGAAAPPADVERLLGPRLDYDVRALSQAVELTAGDVRVRYQARACDLTPRECVDLAALFVAAGRDADAASAYARAFSDPAYDAVSLANTCPWLVDYYERNGRPAEVLALAERAADSGAQVGLQTVSHLYERLGRFDDAEAAAQRAAAYDSSGALFGFYYRAVHTHGRVGYQQKLEEQVRTIFPAGMQPAPLSLTAAPSSGVFVYKDSEFSRRYGVQAGDVIVGIEGWKVDDQRQYRAASATALSSVMKLNIWRGQVRQVEVHAPARLMGVEFRNHPVKGWTD